MDNAYLVAALWIGLALVSSLVSIRLGISVALIEIGMGVVGGNYLGLHATPWIDFLAAFGAVLLTFLAGAEIDPDSLRRHLRQSLIIGAFSFAAPFAAAFLVAYVVLGWQLQAAEIAGLALSTTSVAVIYAVMIESGLAGHEIGSPATGWLPPVRPTRRPSRSSPRRRPSRFARSRCWTSHPPACRQNQNPSAVLS